MMARFEIGEVLLTTSVREVFLGLGDSVLPGNSPFSQCHAKGEVIKMCHGCPLGQCQPTRSIKAAGQLDLHMTLALARPERQTCQGLFVKIKGHAHRFAVLFTF